MTVQTCETLFQQALNACTDMTPEQIRLFAAGFVTGQAEKVSHGACPAAMFRPSPEHCNMLESVVAETAMRYGLGSCNLRFRDRRELWLYLYQPHVESLVYELQYLEENSRAWHGLRAFLCGIPANQIDTLYHRREGFNLPCDRVTEDDAR